MLKVEILNTKTNETRVYEMASIPDEEFNSFIWEEGNFACDCNRHLFFERAGGNDPDMDDTDDRPCGSDTYVVLSIKNSTDELLYHENRPTAAEQPAASSPVRP
jgi:hypothetical protein